jgi:hypothetical protein
MPPTATIPSSTAEGVALNASSTQTFSLADLGRAATRIAATARASWRADRRALTDRGALAGAPTDRRSR